MKRIIIIIVSISLLAACHKNLFEGTDNYMSSFILTTTSGLKLQASITGDSVIIDTKEDISLYGASVDYSISENAFIYPSPDSVEDWNSEHVFRVASKNGSIRDYNYSVRRTSVVYEGSVKLLSQSDVDAFGKTGVTIISGDLIIGEYSTSAADSVRDLSPLSGIKEIARNLIINNSYAGEDLSGFKSLTTSGGIVLGSVNAPLSLPRDIAVDFPSLSEVGYIMINCHKVSSLSFPLLKEVGPLFISSRSLGMLSFPVLVKVDGELTISSGSDGMSESNSSIKQISFPCLKQIDGGLGYGYLTALSSLSFPVLERIGGNMVFSYLTSLPDLKFPSLIHVGGAFVWKYLSKATILQMPEVLSLESLIIKDNTTSSMLSVMDFSALENTRNDIDMEIKYTNDELSFPSLRKVGNVFRLSGFTSVKEINLPQIGQAGGFYLTGLSLLEDLNLSKASVSDMTLISCYALSSVSLSSVTNVTFNGGGKECKLPALLGTDSISGTLTVSNYAVSDTLIFSGIKKIGTYKQTSGNSSGMHISFPDLRELGNLSLTSATWLKSMSMPFLETVGGWETVSLYNITDDGFQLPSLTTISGQFRLSGASSASNKNKSPLTNLSAFASLRSVGSVSISNCGHLKDYSALKEVIPALGEDNWNISDNLYNPSYQDMLEGRYSK